MCELNTDNTLIYTIIYFNLTNGIEGLDVGNIYEDMELYDARFCRIQSTWLEQGRWNDILMTLPDDMLMHLAIGNRVEIVDYASRCEISRALWQGIPFIKYMLYKIWFNYDYAKDEEIDNLRNGRSMVKHFAKVYKEELTDKVKKRITYYKPFAEALNKHRKIMLYPAIDGIIKTTHDGDKEYYINVIRNNAMRSSYSYNINLNEDTEYALSVQS